MLWINEEKLKESKTKSSIVDLASENEYLDIYTFNLNKGNFEKLILSSLDEKKSKFKNKLRNNVPIGFNGIFTKYKIVDSYLKSIFYNLQMICILAHRISFQKIVMLATFLIF